MQRSPKKRIHFSLIITVIGVILLSVIIGSTEIGKPFEWAAHPFLNAGHNIAQWVKRIPEPFTSNKDLVKYNNELLEQNSKLIRENAALYTLIEQEEITNNITNFLDSISEQGVTAKVIGKPGGAQQIIIINKGLNYGIQKGQAVITENGFLIGTVHEVQNLSSYIMLLTDSSQSVAAKIQNETASPGVVKGEFGLSLIMELIPQSDVIEKGQKVVTSALNSLVPPNLIIGSITVLDKKEGEIFQKAHIITPIPLERIELVSVITSRNE